ncbi:MAG TPA: hypothetical protein VFR85_18710 [Anaeromyxobacteraceae bacterium]|nr:hypothetical protein [Anaeromyxobacteraceae bacterium]
MLAQIVTAIALAQYAPPPPPPGYYPPRPPPAYYQPPYARQPPPPPSQPVYAPRAYATAEPLSTWYLGMSMGYGGGYAFTQGATPLPPGTLDGGGFGLAFRAGAVVTPQLLLGVDLSGIHASASGPDYTNPGSTLVNYDLMFTVFPLTRGPFIRTGGGLSTLSLPVPGGGSTTHAGTNLLFGVGYAIVAAPRLELTLSLDYSRQFYSERDLDGSSLVFGYIGFQIH